MTALLVDPHAENYPHSGKKRAEARKAIGGEETQLLPSQRFILPARTKKARLLLLVVLARLLMLQVVRPMSKKMFQTKQAISTR